MNWKKVSPPKYAEALKQEFRTNPSLWYQRIHPEEVAERLFCETKNDFSVIWHTHCDCCFETIDRHTEEDCYVGEDEVTWLCSACYDKRETYWTFPAPTNTERNN